MMIVGVNMTEAEFMEAISQSPHTKAAIIAYIASEVRKNWAETETQKHTKATFIARIEAEIRKSFAQTQARNEERMVADGCTEEAIDWMRDRNEELLPLAIRNVVFGMFGINLIDEPKLKQ